MPEETRPYEKREFRLLSEWLALKYPTWLTWKRVRLGPLPPAPAARIYGILRRWADAIITNQTEVIIIEAKIWPTVTAVGQLEYYGLLFPQTPEFAFLKDLPLTLVFLTTEEDPTVRAFVEAKGIRYEIFEPDWVKEYKKKIYLQKRRRW